MELQLLINFLTILFHLLLFLLGQVIILLLHGTTLFHFIAAQAFTHLKTKVRLTYFGIYLIIHLIIYRVVPIPILVLVSGQPYVFPVIIPTFH